MSTIDKIKKEIERRIDTYINLRTKLEMSDLDGELASKIESYRSLLGFIESLEQEDIPENEETGTRDSPKIEDIQREWYNKGYFKGCKEAHIPARELGLPKSMNADSDETIKEIWMSYNGSLSDFQNIVQHFFTLGQQSQNDSLKIKGFVARDKSGGFVFF